MIKIIWLAKVSLFLCVLLDALSLILLSPVLSPIIPLDMRQHRLCQPFPLPKGGMLQDLDWACGQVGFEDSFTSEEKVWTDSGDPPPKMKALAPFARLFICFHQFLSI
jgi:hypothetical protein